MQAPCFFIVQQIAAKVLRQLCSEIAAKTKLQRWSQKQEWSKIWEHLWWQLESLFPQIYQTFCLSRVNYGLIPLSILVRFSSFQLWFFAWFCHRSSDFIKLKLDDSMRTTGNLAKQISLNFLFSLAGVFLTKLSKVYPFIILQVSLRVRITFLMLQKREVLLSYFSINIDLNIKVVTSIFWQINLWRPHSKQKAKKFFIPILVFAESSTFILPYVFFLLFSLSSCFSLAKKIKKWVGVMAIKKFNFLHTLSSSPIGI